MTDDLKSYIGEQFAALRGEISDNASMWATIFAFCAMVGTCSQDVEQIDYSAQQQIVQACLNHETTHNIEARENYEYLKWLMVGPPEPE